MTDKLRGAAQAIVDRWDSPAWGGSAENLRHTGEYIAELRAALAQQDAQAVPQGWQPIETAPMDGRTVIIGRRMNEFGFVRGYGRFEGKPGSFCSGWISQGFDEVLGNLGLAHPTHWMPLPAPPDAAPTPPAQQDEQAVPTVLYRAMPESNGRTNWTASLVVQGKGDFTLARSEYPHRVRYEADRVRWLIGELDKEPFILDYDADEATPCHLCGGTGERDGKPCWGLNYKGTVHPGVNAAPTPPAQTNILKP